MNRTELLKKMLPGLLPLFVFIVADEIWGTRIGIYVAVSFGVLELIYTYLKNKRFDGFIVSDTLLLAGMGLISVLLDSDVFFKMKPAIIEGIFCVILGISAYSERNLMLKMGRRYTGNVELHPLQIQQMQRSIRFMFWVFAAHTLLIIYSAMYMSKASWAFISGGLFYILAGGVFLVGVVQNWIKKRKTKSEEWLPLVDESGKIVGKAPRSVCHCNPALIHPVIHLHLFDKDGRVFLQKRAATKDIFPNRWDVAVGGHIAVGETPDNSMFREAREELGIRNIKPTKLAEFLYKTSTETEFVMLYVSGYSGDFTIPTEEVSEGRYWSFDEIQNTPTNDFTPHLLREIQFFIDRNKISVSKKEPLI